MFCDIFIEDEISKYAYCSNFSLLSIDIYLIYINKIHML